MLEYKKKEMHLQLKSTHADVDNYLKAFFDGLMSEDKHIADVRISKRWVNSIKGYIQIQVELPSLPSKDNLM